LYRLLELFLAGDDRAQLTRPLFDDPLVSAEFDRALLRGDATFPLQANRASCTTSHGRKRLTPIDIRRPTRAIISCQE